MDGRSAPTSRYLKELVAYWRRHASTGARRNGGSIGFEQFTTTIDGLTVHFIHRRSKHAERLPAARSPTAGQARSWSSRRSSGRSPIRSRTAARPPMRSTSSCRRFPGFAFSQAPREPGYDPARIAAIEAKLMARLGYARYGVQGGDWGSIISTQVALARRSRTWRDCTSTCASAARRPGTDPNAGLTDAERERVKARQVFQSEETGYQQIQGTKPQTIGIALNDSPVGLAAWIVEKFRTWCDCGGNPETDLHEGRAADQHHALLGHPDRGVVGPHLLREPPPRLRRRPPPRRGADRVRRLPEGDHLVAAALARSRASTSRGGRRCRRGGHFAAMEQPQLLVDDVRAFFRRSSLARPVL